MKVWQTVFSSLALACTLEAAFLTSWLSASTVEDPNAWVASTLVKEYETNLYRITTVGEKSAPSPAVPSIPPKPLPNTNPPLRIVPGSQGGFLTRTTAPQPVVPELRGLNLHEQRFEPLLKLPGDTLGSILLPAHQILGQEAPEGYTSLDSGKGSLFAMNSPPPGYEVLVYRPLLFPGAPKSHTLRLIYHQLCQSLYPALDAHLTQLNRIDKTKILFIGLGEGGLAAAYHAITVIRKHASVGPAGQQRNQHNQVGVITVASPPPITADALHLYHLGRENFISFSTIPYEADADNYHHLGYYSMVGETQEPSSATQNILQVPIIESMLPKLFNQQDLTILDTQKLFTEYTTSNSQVSHQALYRHFSDQEEAIRKTISATPHSYNQFIREAVMEDYSACASSLQAVLRDTLLKRQMQSDEFCAKYVPFPSWSLKEPVDCAYEEEEGCIVCRYTHNGARLVFAKYTVHFPGRQLQLPPSSLASRPDTVNPLMVTLLPEIVPPPPSTEELAHQVNLDGCLKALFSGEKLLQPFSPYHPEASTMTLRYPTWLYQSETCRVSIEPSDNSLKLLYQMDQKSFLSLMTSPDRLNPAECRAIYPTPISDPTSLQRSRKYWDDLRTFALNPRGSNLFTVDRIITVPKLQRCNEQHIASTLFQLIHEKMDKDPAHSQFDCRDPQTLWHGDAFCPTLCRSCEGLQNLCSRVHIAKGGLKISLRGMNAFAKVADTSLSEVEMLEKLPLENPDRWTIGLILSNTKQGGGIYLVAFLEGPMYLEFRSRLRKA